MEKYILVVGGPAKGFTFYGPFDEASDAISYAEFINPQDSWFVCPLNQTTCDDEGNWVE